MTEDTKTVGRQAVELLVKNELGSEDQIEGCTEEEIQELEANRGIELPEVYRSCMKHIGKDPNGFRRGSEFAYPEMKRQQEFAEMEIKEGEVDFEFDTNDFVFMGHQGYSFYFFNTEEGDDPPVYVFMSHGEVEQKADSFSEWLFEEIKRHGRIRND